jgi:uncharacterized protein (DUF305 family)
MALSQRFTAACGALTLTLVLAACGGDDTAATDTGTNASSPPAAASSATAAGTGEVSQAHNDADIAFAQMMIVHHRQAIAMADLAADRAQSAEVKSLAEAISAAQGPEIETMTGFLQVWDAQVPEGTSADGMGRMDHGGMDMGAMPGAMTPEMMDQLMAAQGAAFDRMFLEMMTAHHNGAIEMARIEQADGQNPQALELAATIEAGQTVEVEEMRQILASL